MSTLRKITLEYEDGTVNAYVPTVLKQEVESFVRECQRAEDELASLRARLDILRGRHAKD